MQIRRITPEEAEKLMLEKKQKRQCKSYYKALTSAYFGNRCQNCGSENDLCVHHINFDPSDDRLENLTLLCRGCHNQVHDGMVKLGNVEREKVKVIVANLPKCPKCQTNQLQQMLNRWYFQCLRCGATFRLLERIIEVR